MLIRKLDFLKPKKFLKVEVEIYNDQNIALVYIKNKGYSLFIKDNNEIKEVFLVKTKITPENIESQKNFISIIKTLLDQIYSTADIKEYEKQHPEYIFLRLIDDMLNENNVEIINEKSELYSELDDGFTKLEIEYLTKTVNELKNTTHQLEETSISNKFKKIVDQGTNRNKTPRKINKTKN